MNKYRYSQNMQTKGFGKQHKQFLVHLFRHLFPFLSAMCSHHINQLPYKLLKLPANVLQSSVQGKLTSLYITNKNNLLIMHPHLFNNINFCQDRISNSNHGNCRFLFKCEKWIIIQWHVKYWPQFYIWAVWQKTVESQNSERTCLLK